MVLYSSLHFIFCVLDSKFTFHNTTLRFHDSKFEFLFSNSSSHFIFCAHDSTIEFHNATFLFPISIARSSHVALSHSVQRTSPAHYFVQVPKEIRCSYAGANQYGGKPNVDPMAILHHSKSGINGLRKHRDLLVAFTQRSGDTMKIPNL